jgi:multisite-specific tRNA:(cytosine-C5)-methyltransferase
VEDLENTDVKKPKLSIEEGTSAPTEDAAKATEEDTLDLSIEQTGPAPTVESANSSASLTTAKGKARAPKGADLHFKENPFTFLMPDDPVLQACMYAPGSCAPIGFISLILYPLLVLNFI